MTESEIIVTRIFVSALLVLPILFAIIELYVTRNWDEEVGYDSDLDKASYNKFEPDTMFDFLESFDYSKKKDTIDFLVSEMRKSMSDTEEEKDIRCENFTREFVLLSEEELEEIKEIAVENQIPA